MATIIPLIAVSLGIILLAVFAWRSLSIRGAVQARLEEEGIDATSADTAFRDMPTRSWVGRWLYRAGFRRPEAPSLFWMATIGCGLLGLAGIIFSWQQGFTQIAANFVSSIPGGVGNVMVPFVFAMPWFLIVVMIALPTLVVRSVRRRRVKQVEQDLPLMLDLLNTLAQAGIGFDSALDQIMQVQNPRRPLVMEFRTFQYDNLAGRGRIDALRRLMRRVDVSMFSTFISAIIQAEQSGGAMGPTMRIQAEEMRSRRREKAAAAAMTVPTLLIFPMIIGFLPGIFIVILGPMLYEAFGVMEQSFRGVLGQ